MRKIFTLALVFIFTAVVFLGSPKQGYALNGCWCLPGPVAVCGDPKYQPENKGFAGAGNCGGLGPMTNCSCVEKKDCGGEGQKPCTVADPAIVSVIEGIRGICNGIPGQIIQFVDPVDITNAFCGSIEFNNFANQISSSVLASGCKNPAQKPYSTSRGTLCASSQEQANSLVAGAKWTSLKICEQMAEQAKKAECTACASKSGVWTAIGCIETTQEGIVGSVVKLGLGVGGGVVLLMILGASFKLSTSKGDPKATDEAKEMITSAIGGLLFIIFAMVLVRTIGIDILKIPGF